MSVQLNNIKSFLKTLGFAPVSGQSNLWSKEYKNHHNYTIKIRFNNNLKDCIIDYGKEVKFGRKTTSNFNQDESLVVLECVDRLLGKDYSPSKITLELPFPSGKKQQGQYLDICVKDKNDDTFLMIECKTWGSEYNKETQKMLEDGGQLFTYYTNDRNAKYIILYTSTLSKENVIWYKNNIISVSDYKELPNKQDIYDYWDKTFETKGVFEESIEPYNIKFYGIKKSELIPLDINDTSKNEGGIFNRFTEILRRHTISDKNNAFNKVFNLFLCKIVDEDEKSDDEEMDFQWKNNENPEIVLGRLNDLYKKGMEKYLNLKITDYTEDELNKYLDIQFDNSETNNLIRKIFRELRLYKNNEFAFKEVVDKRTFEENAEVAKEIVKLIEKYQIKYSQKQPFLGEFFERLLNIGIKQEVGQFFTPIPIANFVVNAIPFEDIINEKIKNKEGKFLPYVIDYACGSGHFLTEAMDRINTILLSITENELKTKPQKDNCYDWIRSYRWAEEFIYGIEKDYRLSKTTKVACFLNGDGLANILYADGLDNFNSDKYVKLLKNKNSSDNQVFDIVIANPPYSVEGFKPLLKDINRNFELYDCLTDKSDDIECIFIERTKQLLKANGYAGIVLPTTTLINKGIHKKARELILKYFEIYGICEFGKNTFLATGQNTVILFLKRRDNNDCKKVELLVKKFLLERKDFSFNGVENIISEYLNTVRDLDFDTYIEYLKSDNVLKLEEQKLLIYLLTHNQRVVISHYGDTTEEEKRFLGYEHSDMKKYEGIHPYPYSESGIINSKLYDNTNLENVTKINSYILKNFRNENIQEISGDLLKHVQIKSLTELIDFDAAEFEAKIFITCLDNPFLTSNYPLKTLNDKVNDEYIAEILDFMRKPVRKSMRTEGKYPYYGASGKTGNIDDYIFDEKLVLIGEDGARWAKGENTAYIINGKSWVNNHAHVVKPNTDYLLHEYLEEIFCRLDFSYLKTRPNGGKLQKSELCSIKFPFPDVKEQREILIKLSNLRADKRYELFDKLLGIN